MKKKYYWKQKTAETKILILVSNSKKHQKNHQNRLLCKTKWLKPKEFKIKLFSDSIN